MSELRLQHYTLADPTLEHQVLFQIVGSDVMVSCNCRATGKMNAVGARQCSPIGKSNDLDTARGLYNNPSSHTKPFGWKDLAKW